MTDGVFSMDGYLAKLPEITALAARFGALVMVDDSHAVGFVGEHGRGTHEHFGVMGQVDLVTGTLGKALGGASGGYVAGSREVVAWLRQKARPYLFSNSLAPVIAAVSIGVLDELEQGGELRRRLRENAAFFRAELARARLPAPAGRAPHHPGHARARRRWPSASPRRSSTRGSTPSASSSRWCRRGRRASAPR